MGSMITIYKKKNYKIYDAGHGSYIVHNSLYDFHDHHTHINNYHTCIYIIDLCIHKTVPKHLSDYLLVSILRLSEDKNYNAKIRHKLDENKRKRKDNNHV
jgi:hypothetical protein